MKSTMALTATVSMPRSECPICGKTFARQSHLERHQETHRASPRWTCPHCDNSYTRRDALNRHLPRCASGGTEARIPSTRINRACEACSTRKVRCSRGEPCRRCAELNISCHYLVHGSARRQSMHPSIQPENMSALPQLGSESIDRHSEHEDVPPVLDHQHGPSGVDEHNSVGADDHHFFLDPGDPNPWLSWEWTEPPWNILESAPSMPTDVSSEQATFVGSHSGDGVDSQGTHSGRRLASIIDARLDPVEHHRQSIVAYLQKSPDSVGRADNLRWLAQAQFPLLLKTYFTRHHRHTPIIHLPTFDIVACPTSLIFALVLVAASYIPKLGLRARNVIAMAKCAYRFAIESDESLRYGSFATLETLQTLALLSLLDRLMVKRPVGSQYSIDLIEVIRLGRAAQVFDVPSDLPSITWRDWAIAESRRRLGLVLFAFDAFISILHDETPNVRADELNLRFPSPEYIFMAASEAEWRDSAALRDNNGTTSYSVAWTLSSLLCDLNHVPPLPNTLMGRFVLLHGILQYAWRTKRVLLENGFTMSNTAHEPYLKSKASTVHDSLHRWRVGWPRDLLDFEPFPDSPSLYQDRAEAYWYLAGIVMLPQVIISSPKSSTEGMAGALSIQRILERLICLSDQGKLHSVGHDFDAIYRLVTGQDTAGVENNALGTLIYREADTTTAGFED